ncbi:MAG: hypothetical protein LBF56_03760 [Holosporales bacterium]|jgi:hypothetical protein|nr:hypothetical protein [Holosporales bacterium]
MKKRNIPKRNSVVGRFQGEPFVAGFTDIEKDDINIVIGENEEMDDPCLANEECPGFRLLCALLPKSDFQDVAISARYKERTSDKETKTMSYKLYDGSSIKMNGFVSEIAIEFSDVVPEFGKLNDQSLNFLMENKTIYRKTFQVQTSSKNIENFVDEDMEASSIIHTKSRAHCFAGSYFKGVKFSDIQQYLFYVGTGYRAEPYISVIKASEIIQTKKAKLNHDITVDSLSTLEDDICDGKILIEFPDGSAYQSICSAKDTLVSNICQISFKRKENKQ